MNDQEEQKLFIEGKRAAWAQMLRGCLRQLGYDASETMHASWVVEREEAIAALREVCGEFGDNDWSEELSLVDVIKKHLVRHLQMRPE